MAKLDRDYLLEREKHARTMAERAGDARVKDIHFELAAAYAARARDGGMQRSE